MAKLQVAHFHTTCICRHPYHPAAMGYLWLCVLISYFSITWYSLVQSVTPSRCQPKGECYKPLTVPGQGLRLELWLYQYPNSNESEGVFEWVPVPSCRLDVVLPDPGIFPKLLTDNGTKCEVPIPDFARIRSPDKHRVHPLQARFMLLNEETNSVVGNVPFNMTRVVERRPSDFWMVPGSSGKVSVARNLLDQPIGPSNSSSEEIRVPTWVPYLKYGRAAVRIRFVAEDRPYGRLRRADGLALPKWNKTTYAPTLYVDDLSLQRSAQVQLAPPEDNKPPVSLQVKLGTLSPVFDGLNRQAHAAIEAAETLLPGEELDDLRYFLQDEHLYRFMLSQIISYLHLTFDYLAFRDEIRFYRGKKNLSGVSISSAITRLTCSVIILLYLLDGGGTSWIVLFSLFSSCCVAAWKVWKLLRPEFTFRFPFMKFRQVQYGQERETAEYDRIAVSNLAMVLYPLVIGWSLYALQHYQYTSWWSWFISNMANAVYTFGFVSLCPQLYINYRLKSVAHLPWKVFMYKVFNTFVDDAFAWLVDMPWKHRIMTLRDDVIFLMLLAQVYLYRVDKSRTNEFGYSYDNDENHHDKVEGEEAHSDAKLVPTPKSATSTDALTEQVG